MLDNNQLIQPQNDVQIKCHYKSQSLELRMQLALKKSRLIVKLTEGCNSSIDPVSLWLIGGDIQHKNKVGGMSGGAQNTPACAGFVDRTLVDGSLSKSFNFTGLQPDGRQAVVKNFWQ